MQQYLVNVDGRPILVAARTPKQAAIAARQLVALSKVAATIPAGVRPQAGGLGL